MLLLQTRACRVPVTTPFRKLTSQTICRGTSSFRLPNMGEIHGGNPLVLYHYPCPDGIFAALSAYLRLTADGREPCFVPNRTWAPVSVEGLGLAGHETVYLLDYVGPSGFPVALAGAAQSVIVLDHHKTAAEQMPPVEARPFNLTVELDMDRSGATIARDHFKPEVSPQVSRMIDMIEDGDLWRWKLPGSDAFYAGLGALELEYDAAANPSIFATLLGLDPDDLIEKGRSILEEQRRRIALAMETVFEVDLGGAEGQASGWGRCLGVRAEDMTHLRSRLGNEVATESGRRGLRAIAAVVYSEGDLADQQRIKVSLRSKGEEDTTVISQAFGGGGHRNASGFTLPLSEFNSWVVQSPKA